MAIKFIPISQNQPAMDEINKQIITSLVNEIPNLFDLQHESSVLEFYGLCVYKEQILICMEFMDMTLNASYRALGLSLPLPLRPFLTGPSLPAFPYRTIHYRPSITGLSLPNHSLPAFPYRTIHYQPFLTEPKKFEFLKKTRCNIVKKIRWVVWVEPPGVVPPFFRTLFGKKMPVMNGLVRKGR